MSALALAAGAVAGLLAEEALMRRERGRPDPEADAGLAFPPGARHHRVPTDDGGHVAVVETGPAGGRPVVLLHGVTLSAVTWCYQLRRLADRHRVLALDHRGHGASVAGEAGYSIERLAQDVATVMTTLDVEDAVVVGHSMGGMVALELAAGDRAEAARIGHLVLVSTTAASGAEIPGFATLVELAAPGQQRALGLAARLRGGHLPSTDLSYLVARLGLGRRPSPTHVELTRAMSGALPAAVLADLWRHVVSFDARDRLHRITAPTTVVVGTADRLTPPRDARLIVRAVPGARLVELAGAGHMPMLERHDRLSDLLAEVARREGDGAAA